MKIYENSSKLVGNTPLIMFSKLSKEEKTKTNIIAKAELFNPAGSIKDRVALSMIEDAENKGILKSDSVIIEPTSGNTGIGLASIASLKGYKVILTMPESMSIERRNLLKSYGAEIILTDSKLGMDGAVKKALELQSDVKNGIILGQFDNMANPQTHFETTGPEIWNDTDGKIDILVCCIGTGGTISGVGKFLKSKNKDIKIVAVEPSSSPLLSKGTSGPHKIQGIGANFVPKILDQKIYDEIFTVSNEQAFEMANKIAKKEGLLVGISSGACVFASVELAKLEENKDKTIVAIMPDTGERYLSSGLFS